MLWSVILEHTNRRGETDQFWLKEPRVSTRGVLLLNLTLIFMFWIVISELNLLDSSFLNFKLNWASFQNVSNSWVSEFDVRGVLILNFCNGVMGFKIKYGFFNWWNKLKGWVLCFGMSWMFMSLGFKEWLWFVIC